jgi:PAS domain S-box-containing protein
MKIFLTRVDLRIALTYAIFGGLWILLSDRLLESLVTDPAVLTDIQTYKGGVFVLLSSLLIFLLLRRELNLRGITEGRVIESEERYRQLFENSMDAILLTAPDGSIRAANPAACQMFNKTEEQIKQVGRDGLVDVSDPRLKSALEERARTGKFHGELTFIRADGSKFEGELSTTLFKNSKGVDRTGMVLRDISERKRTEETLREKTEELNRYFTSSLDLLCVADTDGYFRHLNPEWEKTLGYSLAELEGRRFLDFVHPQDMEATLNTISQLETQETVLNFENRYLCKDGSYRWIEWRSVPIGKLIYAAAHDITERKRTEDTLYRNEQMLRLFVEHAPASIAMFDHEMKYIIASQRYHTDYGLGEQDLIGKSHYEVFPEISERWKEIHRRCLAGAVESAEDDPFPRADGSMDWVRWEIRPWHEASHEIGGIILFSEVVTNRKQAELTLRENEEQYRTLVEISPNAIFINRQNRIEFINQSGIKLLGASSAEEIIGKSPLEIFHPDFHEIIQERIRIMLEDKKPVGLIEEQIVRLDGKIRDVEVTATPFEDHGATSVQVVMRDITERKRAREELRLSRDRLAELSRRLVEAHEAESRAIGRELHDQIGQALTALKITLEMIPQLPPERSAKKMETAQGLVDELLNHVRRISLDLRPPMLDDLGLIPTLLWHVNRYQEQTNIEVDFKHSGVEGKRFSPEIETTAYRVIQEALTNTTRHTKTARVELQVRADDQLLQIIIADHGQGFDPQNVLDRQTSIGLRGMRERVNLLSGIFHIESKLNQGTVVEIEIPLSEK